MQLGMLSTVIGGMAILLGLSTPAHAKGMSQLARDTGLGRESLYKALSGDRQSQLRHDTQGDWRTGRTVVRDATRLIAFHT